jgi:hypothetical protein
MDLLFIGGVVIVVIGLGLQWMTRLVAETDAIRPDDEESERCAECGCVRDSPPHPQAALFAPGLTWPTCPACGGLDLRSSWLNGSMWD